MKHYLLACLTTAGVFAANIAFADHSSNYLNSNRSGYNTGNSFHHQLQHKSYDRAMQHQQSHQYPMSSYQHRGLHNQLNHEAAHDSQRHRVYDRVYNSPNRWNNNTYQNHSASGYWSNQGWQEQTLPSGNQQAQSHFQP